MTAARRQKRPYARGATSRAKRSAAAATASGSVSPNDSARVLDAEGSEGANVPGHLLGRATKCVAGALRLVETHPNPSRKDRHRAPNRLGGRSDRRDAACVGVRSQRAGVPAVAEAARPTQRRSGAAADPDRQACALPGERLEGVVRQRMKAAVERLVTL